jgi:hypothetical protein
MIVKAHPGIQYTVVTIAFQSGTNVDVFWKRIHAYFAFAEDVVEVGAMDRNYITPQGGSAFSFNTAIELPGMSTSQATIFIQPLVNSLNSFGGAPITSPTYRTTPYGSTRNGNGYRPGSGSRFASRLFPRANWKDPALYNETMAAIRNVVEGGYTFHGLFMAPTEQVAGWPGSNSGVNPAFRVTIMHADIFDPSSTLAPPDAIKQAHDRLNSFMTPIRQVTAGSGAYVNEADVEEPDWQSSFYGSNYQTLLQIKNKRDPLNVFWAPAAVGSEGWTIRTENGLPTQNGKLCKVG